MSINRFRKYADGGVTDPLAGMSPTDLTKLRAELFEKSGQNLTVDEQWRNVGKTGAAILGSLPVIGNAMSAYDAWRGGQAAVEAARAGDIRGTALNATATGLSALGALSPLPWSRRAGQMVEGAGSTARIFAGPSAKTADHVKLTQAEEMRNAGVAPEEIWRETGWFWGHDGKPRFEIDDSGATVDRSAIGPEVRPLGEVLHHPELYAAYPDAAKIRTRAGTEAELGQGVTGDYIEGYRSKYFPESSRPGQIRLKADAPMTGQVGLLPTTLHELQHDIQATEGWAKGSNGRMAYDPRPKSERMALRERLLTEAGQARDEAFKARAAGDHAASDAAHMRAWNLEWQADQMKQRGWGAYFREAGEVEARNVEMRREMSAEARRAAYPTTTQDIIPEAVWHKPQRANGGRTSRWAAYANGGRVTVGAVKGDTGGREDALHVQVPEGAYVIPADVVAALGEGNTAAGMRRLEGQFGKVRPVRGGPVVPIQISDGEFVVPPEVVEMVGGPDVLDEFVMQARAQFVQHLQQLEEPNGAGQ